MSQSRLLELIAKKKAGELSPSELIELNKLINELPDNAAISEIIDKVWETPLEISEQFKNEAYVDSKWQQARKKLQGTNNAKELTSGSKRKVISLFKYVAAAASIIIVLLTVFRPSGRKSATDYRPNVVSTKNGSRSKVQLPDGTQVWLNAGSKLTYDESFGKNLREVQLSGEAFFDVTKDAEHPFIIHTQVMNIKVVGTAFDVKAYPDGKTTEATLLRGLIEVSFPKRPEEKFFLKPNQKISVVNNELVFDRKNIDSTSSGEKSSEEPFMSLSKISYEPHDSTIIETAWINNKLVFRNERFGDLARDMERWFNVSIQFKDSLLMEKRMTGTFEHETITDALNELKLFAPFHYKLNKEANTIVIE
jgi:ferric-dicitrate binding protein FerR (iron transport regulator)